MKITVAKILCFFTILLMSSNMLLSSVLPQHIFKENAISGKSSLQQIKITNNSSNFNFACIAETDPFEDFEFVTEIPELLSFGKDTFRFPEKGNRLHYFNSKTGCKIPRWLWIRHILI